MDNQLQFIKTDTIKAHYLQIPYTSTSAKFLVEMREPMQTTFVEVVFPNAVLNVHHDPLDALRDHLLNNWHSNFKNHKRSMKKAGLSWIYDVNKVELIECAIYAKLK